MRELQPALAFLGRNRAATWLLLLVAAAAAAGSFVPQAPADPGLRASWLTAASDALGPAVRLLTGLHLSAYYASPWWWLPAMALLVSLTVCTARRWRRVWLKPTLLTHVAPLALACGVAMSWRAAWRQPILLEPGGPGAPVAGETGVQVAVTRWSVGVRPDGSPSSYESDVAVRRGGQALCAATVRPSHPLDCGGIAYVLTAYRSPVQGSVSANQMRSDDPAVAAGRVEITAVQDPGYGVTIGAFSAIVLGATLSMWRPGRWRRA
jgi:cytochrome c biogenesis protein ResB